MPRFCLALIALSFVATSFAEDLDYSVTDPELKVVRLDSSPDASFLSVRTDTTGRIFVGGRKTLYVYDLDEAGKYKPRHLLCEFPDHTWVNDIEIRGDDLYIVTVSAVYRLPGARVKRDGVAPERLLWGVPNGHVHQCFHACAWGPEGDLYVSMGDPLWYYGDFSRPDHWGHWTMFFRSSPASGSPVAPRQEAGSKPDADSQSKPESPKDAVPATAPPVAERQGYLEKTVRVGNADWAAMPYNGVGAVFRIRPDGTNLRSFSRGLRNPCGLCFDKNWNLFTNDNDHEGLPSLYAPGRLLHVTEGSYFSWPRGWLQSKTPDRADILPSVNEEMGRAVPVLQTYYADGYFPAKYENSLMVARWCRRQVTYFPLEAKGSTFTAKEHVLLEGRDQARPVGVCVGRGGRVFVTICYMAQNEGSPTYRSDLAVITRKDDPDTMPFEGYDVTKAEPKQLWSELEQKGWWRRNVAHQEIRRQHSPMANWLKEHEEELMTGSVDPLALPELKRRLMPHLMYLSHYSRSNFVTSEVKRLRAYDFRDEIPKYDVVFIDGFRHVVNAMTTEPRSTEANEQLLKGVSRVLNTAFMYVVPSINFDSLTAYAGGRSRTDRFFMPWESLVDRTDHATQITATQYAAKYLPPSSYPAMTNQMNAKLRLMGVLTAGFRLTMPAVDAKLPDEAPLAPQQKEEANIILFADEKEPIDLRTLGRVGNYTVAEHWKALKHTDEQEQLFALLMERLDDTDDKVRLQAAHFLSLLNDPRSEPKIALVTANVQDKRLNLGKLEHLKPHVWMLGPVPDADGFKTVHPVETAAIDLAAKYTFDGKMLVPSSPPQGSPVAPRQEAGSKKDVPSQTTPARRKDAVPANTPPVAERQGYLEWKLTKPSSPDRPLYDFHTLFGPTPNSSVYSFFRFDVPTAQRMQLLVGSEDGVKVWHNGKLVFENDVVRPLIQLDDVVPLDLQPGSNDVLVRVRMQKGVGGQYLHFKHLGDVRLSIPDKPDGLSLAERLKSAGSGSQPIDPKFLEVDWPEAVKQGDVVRGKKLFAAESLGCAKCHAATATQAGGGGPSLTDAGKRFTVPYLVESVLAPNKVISPVFKSSIIETKDGKVITGLVVSETADQLEVLLPDTKRITLKKSDIEERKLGDTSAMPPGVVKTVDELRDVIAYLLSNPTE